MPAAQHCGTASLVPCTSGKGDCVELFDIPRALCYTLLLGVHTVCNARRTGHWPTINSTVYLPTLNWPMGWALIGVYLTWTVATALLIIPRCPELLIERMARPKDAKGWDVALMSVIGLRVGPQPPMTTVLPLFIWPTACLTVTCLFTGTSFLLSIIKEALARLDAQLTCVNHPDKQWRG